MFKFGVYQHFKGKYYLRVLNVRDCDDASGVYVLYLSLYRNEFPFLQPWIRPIRNFEGMHPTYNVKRMTKVTAKSLAVKLLNKIKAAVKRRFK